MVKVTSIWYYRSYHTQEWLVVIPYLLAKITNNNTGLFFIVAESLFKSYWWLRLSELLMFDTTKVTINKVREWFCICLLKSNVITAIIVFAWSKLKHSNILCYLTIRLARHLCSSTPLVFIYMFGRMYVILYFDPPYFCVRSAFNPVPNFTKLNLPV